jgi:glycerol-3-phosphate O-acyltransferase
VSSTIGRVSRHVSGTAAWRNLALRTTRRRNAAAPPSSEAPEVAHLRQSERFHREAAALAERLGEPREAVLAQAEAHLQEMSATHSEAVYEWWKRFGRWMLRGYDELMDEEALGALRTLDQDHSLVFLISHRSYLDEWALPSALVDFGIEPPFGFAGANLDFFPLGTIARRTGIVHIRRATSGVPVYKFALRAFIGSLVANRANLIWSIEGGRSRTGKLRPPRLGLLRYVVDAVEQVDGPELLLVPVSILYDQLPTHEVELMTSEARGLGKQPENARWFFEYVRGLRQRLGRIYVDFGEPIALRARLAELRSEAPSGTHAVERIALEVSHRINVATPVTPTAAVCIAMLAADRALTLDEIQATVRPLADYLSARRWPTAGAASLTDRPTVRRAVQDLVSSGVLTSFRGQTTVWCVGPKQHLIAAVYRNSAIHVLVSRSIVELVLVGAANADGAAAVDPGRAAWEEALRLRDLLKFEFFFPGRKQFAKDLHAELVLISADVALESVTITTEQAREYVERLRMPFAHLVLRPFIDAYWVVATQLVEHGESRDLDEERFLGDCLQVGRQWALQRRIASMESVSAEMFRTAMRLARHRGLVEPGSPDLLDRRQELVDEICGVRRRLQDIARRATQRTDPNNDLRPDSPDLEDVPRP